MTMYGNSHSIIRNENSVANLILSYCFQYTIHNKLQSFIKNIDTVFVIL